MRVIDVCSQHLIDEFSEEDRKKASLISILGLSCDTRTLQSGDFFIAIDGTQTTGARFIGEAIKKGASGALVSYKAEAELKGVTPATFPILRCVQNPRTYLGEMAGLLFPERPKFLVAVTGTNGKTSVAFFAHQIFHALGFSSACLGTVGIEKWKQGEERALERSTKLTTPDPIAMRKALAVLCEEGIDAIALEASSHGLDQDRLKGLSFVAGAFTNLSQDHLDYHATMQDYYTAKMRLFMEIIRPGQAAVLNADIPEYEDLASSARTRGQRIISFGTRGTDIKLNTITHQESSLIIEFSVWGKPFSITLPVVGDYQVSNALCALGLVLGALKMQSENDSEIRTAVGALEHLLPPPGRLEYVGVTPMSAQIFVDYAHTPDAYERVLKTLRFHTSGKIWILFGCGGDRDPYKRPLMGKAADQFADGIILTDDNPRSEDPGDIRKQVALGISQGRADFYIVPDRERAIETVIQLAGPGDLILLAGKGHEEGQIIGSTIHPFNDKDVALRILATKFR